MPRAKNEYTAVAGAEKRLAELLEPAYGVEMAANIALTLTGGEAGIEYKPRLKAIVITLPIPEPAPEPKLGKFSPTPVTDEYDPYPGDEELEPSAG